MARNVDAFNQQGSEFGPLFFVFVGHSLGGTAAQCLCQKVPNSRSISLNGGAACTNPVLQGPGPERATFYHVFGDLVSTHMSPNAARVIRIAKEDRNFGVVYPHSSARFLAGDGAWRYATADEEDEQWLKWGNRGEVLGWLSGGLIPFASLILKMNLPRKSPIPGSKRFNDQQKKWYWW